VLVLVHVASPFKFSPYPNAGTRSAELTKTDKYKLLCQQRGMDFVPIVITTSGGMGEQFQRQYWNPHWHWIRVAEDEAMKIGPWVARKRKALCQILGRGCKL
jgi:hypothetical protein